MLLFCCVLALFILRMQPQSWFRPGFSACPGRARQPSTRPCRQHRPVQQHGLPGPGLQQSKAPMPFVSDLPLLQIYQFSRGSHRPGSASRATSVSPACCLPGGSAQQERPPLSNGRGKRRIGDGLESRPVHEGDRRAVGQDGMSRHSCNPSWLRPQLARVGPGK